MGDDFGKITDEALEQLRERVGERIDEPQPYIEEATKDTIRHWTHGIGDDNPLYLDEEYAAAGPYGEIVAPPTTLLAASEVVSSFSMGLPGVHEMWGGAEFDWYRPIRRDTRFRTESYFHDLEEKETQFGGRSVVQTYRTEFYDQDDEHLATGKAWNFRVERDASRERGKYEKQGEHETAHWSEEEIEEFADHYTGEERRGSDTRYFEDVEVGEELDTLLKGPYTSSTAIAFKQGWSEGWCRANRRLFTEFDKNPGLVVINEKHGAPEPPEIVHWNDEYAREVGVPAAYDYGPERVAWLGHVCTDWMGDEGFLTHFYSEVRSHNLKGDVTWCSGEVVDKRVEDGQHLVDVELSGHDQRDRLTCTGDATIRLPSKE